MGDREALKAKQIDHPPGQRRDVGDTDAGDGDRGHHADEGDAREVEQRQGDLDHGREDEQPPLARRKQADRLADRPQQARLLEVDDVQPAVSGLRLARTQLRLTHAR